MNVKSVTIAHALRNKSSVVTVHRITGWYSAGEPATEYVTWLRSAAMPSKQAPVGVATVTKPGLYMTRENDKPTSYFFIFGSNDELKIKFVDEPVAIAGAMLMQSGVHGVPGLAE